MFQATPNNITNKLRKQISHVTRIVKLFESKGIGCLDTLGHNCFFGYTMETNSPPSLAFDNSKVNHGLPKREKYHLNEESRLSIVLQLTSMSNDWMLPRGALSAIASTHGCSW